MEYTFMWSFFNFKDLTVMSLHIHPCKLSVTAGHFVTGLLANLRIQTYQHALNLRNPLIHQRAVNLVYVHYHLMLYPTFWKCHYIRLMLWDDVISYFKVNVISSYLSKKYIFSGNTLIKYKKGVTVDSITLAIGLSECSFRYLPRQFIMTRAIC